MLNEFITIGTVFLESVNPSTDANVKKYEVTGPLGNEWKVTEVNKACRKYEKDFDGIYVTFKQEKGKFGTVNNEMILQYADGDTEVVSILSDGYKNNLVDKEYKRIITPGDTTQFMRELYLDAPLRLGNEFDRETRNVLIDKILDGKYGKKTLFYDDDNPKGKEVKTDHWFHQAQNRWDKFSPHESLKNKPPWQNNLTWKPTRGYFAGRNCR